ncbi:hypothetical protein ACFPER_08445 [Agromyces aurantiacus]|uniref:DUF1707 domain-containing protein n=1 Tax=Agromyces aurantiacus TaxID=165814 RepID=A0ABV9R6A9_9MICO|nr:hypothetical protein [Agromyces aurantiacus]MBM7503497.1 hypothetical protein [Agromyces aurantiacus]
MTTTAPATEEHLTVLDFLGDEGRAHLTADAITAALVATDRDATGTTGVERLSTTARGAAYRQVGAAAARLLDFDLVDGVVAGWLKYKALLDAGRRTLGSTSREVVELASHRVTSTYKPVVDVYIDDVRVGSVEFQLSLVFQITGCAADVADGDLVAVEGGDVTVTGTLAVRGKTLATKSRKLDAHLALNLRRPVHLTPRPS